MITTQGYGPNNENIAGIAITWKIQGDTTGAAMANLLQVFEKEISRDDGAFRQRCDKEPKRTIAYVYIIINMKLAYRCNFVGWFSKYDVNNPYGYSYILLTGPLIKCPFDRPLPGFRGFRYTEKLF